MASRPLELGWSGWKAALLRVKDALRQDRVGLVAAGVAFFGLLALFPAITAVIALGGLLFEPSEITEPIRSISAAMPERAAQIILDQATAVAGTRDGGLGLAAILGLAIALYSASKGVANLIEGINVAYNQSETRGFIRLKALTLGLTLLLIVGVVVAIAAIVVLPGLLAILDLGPVTEMVITVVRWAFLLVLAVLSIAAMYRFGADREPAQWRWVLPGALLSCLLWIGSSLLFALYAENFGSYQESFGTLAGVIILMIWLWISAYVVLLGAELNGELEAQTYIDTTTGRPLPRGARGAVKADAYAPDDA
ncbi:membrane protein [Celeribacter indicus]|uniref:Ribonuclease BN n=2 Tax=Celeribacter indicus TaxID=1208324 RepID=A0A0B5E9Q5_9RHOB|nr:ribonuclease BN [Celeribacter indicus]SDW45304.1 membrane protein [Celeribacter indicus]